MRGSPFTWRDGERLVRFGRGALADAPALIGTDHLLLTTPRHLDAVPTLLATASEMVEVPAGLVDEIAAELRPAVAASGAELLVAVGGGRVVDVAKALAAAEGDRRVAAIPTTLSAAEMTGIHRHATGVPPATPRVRPAIVVNDPALSASQPDAELAASALNSLGHALEAPLTANANPVATLAALEAARLLVAALLADAPPDRDGLALGALLAGYAMDSAGYGLHHVLSQTLVRFAGLSHGTANAIMLPHSARALQRRDPAGMRRVAVAIGQPVADAATRMRARSGVQTLREAGVGPEELERCVERAAERPELTLTPPRADAEEIRALYAAAYDGAIAAAG